MRDRTGIQTGNRPFIHFNITQPYVYTHPVTFQTCFSTVGILHFINLVVENCISIKYHVFEILFH